MHLRWEFRVSVYTDRGPSHDLGDDEGAVSVRIFWEGKKIKCKSMISWKSILNNSEHPRNFWTFLKISRKSDLRISACSFDPGWCAHQFSASEEVAGPRYPLPRPGISGDGIFWIRWSQIPGIELTALFVVLPLVECSEFNRNNYVSCVLNTLNGDLVFQLRMISFKFDNALMEEHFNEKYVLRYQSQKRKTVFR